MSIAGEVAKDAISFTTGHVALVGSIALAVGIIAGYAFWHHTVYQEGFQACKAEVAEATKQAEKEIADKQSTIDKLAASSNPALKAKLDQQQKDIDTLRRMAEKPPHVLQGQCTVPPDQVAAYNGIGK